VLDALAAGLVEAGHSIEIADLRAEGFDPRLGPEDEPDWDAPKVFSPTVLEEQARVARNDALCMVFPVWWWSFPATSKGWIDRVWNRGWAYDGGQLALSKARLLAMSSGSADHYAKRGYDSAMEAQLITGIMHYCGIPDASIELLHGALGSDEKRSVLLGRAAEIGRTF
jgi:NAD(P)H dehydrogenase (quinone)